MWPSGEGNRLQICRAKAPRGFESHRRLLITYSGCKRCDLPAGGRGVRIVLWILNNRKVNRKLRSINTVTDGERAIILGLRRGQTRQ